MEKIEEIKKAKRLLDDGLINEEEFKVIKSEILSEPSDTNQELKTQSRKKSKQKSTKPIPALEEDIKQSRQNKENLKAKLENEKKTQVKDEKSNLDFKLKRYRQIESIKKWVFFLVLLLMLIYTTNLKPNDYGIIGFIGSGIAFFWLIIKWGRRYGFFFWAPYILFATSNILFVKGVFGNDPEFNVINIFLFFLGVTFLVFLYEYYRIQAKCTYCGKRVGMKYFGESGSSSYNYIGSKSYDIRSNSGEKIGSYEGPVNRTVHNYTAHYVCQYCYNITCREESDEYDN